MSTAPDTIAVQGDDRVAMLDLAAEVLVHRRTVAIMSVVGVGLAVLVALLRPVRYEASTTVMAAVPAGAESRLAGLASQFGLGDLAGGRGGLAASPDLIVHLARSPGLLDRVLDDTVGASSPEGPRTVIDLLQPLKSGNAAPIGGAAALRRAKAIRDLRDLVAVVKNKSTGSATLAVTTEWPLVSFDLTQAIIRELNKTFQQMGRGQAAEERRFVADRLRDGEEQLQAAEGALAAFLTANRDFRNSPQLTFEHDHLQRIVSRRQQVVVSLSESSEDAAIRSVRDTPALLVVEPASPPVVPQPRRRVLIVALGCVGGALAGVLYVLAAAAAREMDRRQRPDWMEFKSALVGALHLRTPPP